MLRLYLTEDKSVRLHVWDNRYVTPGASEMHTHPWGMKSTVVAGVVENIRYVECEPALDVPHLPYHRQTIFCGAGGGLEGDPEDVELLQFSPETYLPGESYQQRSDEIHVSRPQTGTVTIVERSFGSDVDRAYVYWPAGSEWGSAEPRPAADYEVISILGEALSEPW